MNEVVFFAKKHPLKCFYSVLVNGVSWTADRLNAFIMHVCWGHFVDAFIDIHSRGLFLLR